MELMDVCGGTIDIAFAAEACPIGRTRSRSLDAHESSLHEDVIARIKDCEIPFRDRMLPSRKVDVRFEVVFLLEHLSFA